MAANSKRQRAPTPETSIDEEYGSDSASDYSVEVQWEILYPSLKKSDKKLLETAEYQNLPYAEEMISAKLLDHHYIVKPVEEWESLRKYKRFQVGGEIIAVGEFVYVNPVKQGYVAKYGDERDWWKARILEVRAADSAHVYARIAWMYSPDDLPESRTNKVRNKSGRQDYHGAHELIACNMQDIVSVLSFAGKAPVELWDENKDEHIAKALYWRQHYNHLTGELSTCRQYCKCKKYYNPDTTMLPCLNQKCPIDWLHLSCLEHKILIEVYNQNKENYGENEQKEKKKKKDKGRKRKNISSPSSNPWDEILHAEFLVNEKPPLIKIRMVGSNSSNCASDTWTQPIPCLGCGQMLQ